MHDIRHVKNIRSINRNERGIDTFVCSIRKRKWENKMVRYDSYLLIYSWVSEEERVKEREGILTVIVSLV
jgi:hypothetical protein